MFITQGSSRTELGTNHVFADREVVWAIYVSDRCCVTKMALYVVLPPRPVEDDNEGPTCFPGAAVDVFLAEPEIEADWDLSDILPFGVATSALDYGRTLHSFRRRIASI